MYKELLYPKEYKIGGWGQTVNITAVERLAKGYVNLIPLTKIGAFLSLFLFKIKS